MALQSGRHVRLTPKEKEKLKTMLDEKGIAMPIIQTTDDYFDASIAASSEDALEIINKAYNRFKQRCDEERQKTSKSDNRIPD